MTKNIISNAVMRINKDARFKEFSFQRCTIVCKFPIHKNGTNEYSDEFSAVFSGSSTKWCHFIDNLGNNVYRVGSQKSGGTILLKGTIEGNLDFSDDIK